jgi:hypothetical protein
MGLIKLAFLGIHYRKLGPKESGFYQKQNEKIHKIMHSKPVKAALIGGTGALWGGVGVLGTHTLGGSTKQKIINGLIGAGMGAAAETGMFALDKQMHESKMKKLKDLNKKWVVLGKGKSHLDNHQ